MSILPKSGFLTGNYNKKNYVSKNTYPTTTQWNNNKHNLYPQNHKPLIFDYDSTKRNSNFYINNTSQSFFHSASNKNSNRLNSSLLCYFNFSNILQIIKRQQFSSQSHSSIFNFSSHFSSSRSSKITTSRKQHDTGLKFAQKQCETQMKSAIQNNDSTQVFEIWKYHVEENGRLPTRNMMNMTMNALNKTKRENDALDIFHRFIPEFPSFDAYSIAAALNACMLLKASHRTRMSHYDKLEDVTLHYSYQYFADGFREISSPNDTSHIEGLRIVYSNILNFLSSTPQDYDLSKHGPDLCRRAIEILEMLMDDFPALLDISLFNCALKACDVHQQSEQSEVIIEVLRRIVRYRPQQISCNDVTYSMLMKHYAIQGRQEKWDQLFREMESHPQLGGCSEITAVVFMNTLLRMQFKVKLPKDGMMQWFWRSLESFEKRYSKSQKNKKMMKTDSPQPSSTPLKLMTVGVTICGRFGDVPLLEELHDELCYRRRHIQVDRRFYCSLLMACSRLKATDQAVAWYAEMKERGLVDSVHPTTALMNVFAETGDIRIFKVFNQEFQVFTKLQPSTSSSSIPTTNIDQEIFSTATNQKPDPDIFVFNALIKWECNFGSRSGVDHILKQMKEYNIEPNRVTNIMIRATKITKTLNKN